MNTLYSDFTHYKTIILQEIIYENYYLSQKDAEEHIELFTPILYKFFLDKATISSVLYWIMTYDHCGK